MYAAAPTALSPVGLWKIVKVKNGVYNIVAVRQLTVTVFFLPPLLIVMYSLYVLALCRIRAERVASNILVLLKTARMRSCSSTPVMMEQGINNGK